MSLRYRFTERYSRTEDPSRPDVIVQYQVGSRETFRREIEKSQGAPERAEINYHTIYTERPAKVGKLGEVSEAVRHYDSFRIAGAQKADARTTGPLQDLSLYFRLRAGTVPLLISLTPDRSIRQVEYDFVQDQIFVPRLSTLLPPRPVRVGDTWPIARQAAQSLLGKLPEAGEFALEGSLTAVRKATQGTALTAIIEITGELDLDRGKAAVRAQISFEFEPPPAAADPKAAADPPSAGRRERDAGIVEARGYISKVLMGRTHTKPLDDGGRFQEVDTRELVLQRRRVVAQAGVVESPGLTVPETPPTADEMNSWLLYDDPQGRFHFRHPQEMEIVKYDPNALELQHVRPGGKADTLIIGAVPKDADPVQDRKWTDPQAFVRDLQQNAARKKHQVVSGQMGWLPEQDWAPLNRKVYRYEAALKTDESPQYVADSYLVLFTRGDRFVIQALTDRDDHLVFRNQAETLIGSLDLGPSAPGTARTQAQLQPDRPSALRPPANRAAVPPAQRTP